MVVDVTEVRKYETWISFWQMRLIYSSKYDKGYINLLRKGLVSFNNRENASCSWHGFPTAARISLGFLFKCSSTIQLKHLWKKCKMNRSNSLSSPLTLIWQRTLIKKCFDSRINSKKVNTYQTNTVTDVRSYYVISHFVIIIIISTGMRIKMQKKRYCIRMPYAHVLAAVIVIVNHDRWTHEQINTSDSNFPFW